MAAHIHFAGNVTLSATPNTPASIAALLTAAGYVGANALVELILQPTGAGNVVLSSNPSIALEANGVLLAPTLSFPTLVMRAEEHSSINTAELYLLSATASKTVSIICTSIA